MLKVLLVDDEYFIAQGLEVLVDWNAEGYEISAIVSNGQEALDYLKKNPVDLVISDVMMPAMTGLELLETVKNEHISDASFVILSGYEEFSFAQQALRYGCIDYLLKPIKKEDLLTILRKINHISENAKLEQKFEEAYLFQKVASLLYGKNEGDLAYVRDNMRLSEGVRYVEIEITNPENVDGDEDEDDLNELREKLYQACCQLLEDDSDHCLADVYRNSMSTGIGFVFCDYMAEEKHCTETQYIQWLYNSLGISLRRDVRLLIGKKVQDIGDISRSYETVNILKNLWAFRHQKPIYYYEDEMQEQQEKDLLCKQNLDAIIQAIDRNEQDNIRNEVKALFDTMQLKKLDKKGINLNVNYLLYHLIHLASKLDSETNQQEILQFISASSFDEGLLRGSSMHFSNFACEYADYLAQVKNSVPSGVLRDIEQEIKEHYAENLTLQELGKKYFINSSYLGQLFRKTYGQSFKNYLTNYRIDEACRQLLYTDKKIGEIAENVGYKDIDYFIAKFVGLKGCTPTGFRKKRG